MGRPLDPCPIDCPACGGRFPIRAAALRSLRATCPGCGASLAAVGERMLAESARMCQQIDLFWVAFDLHERLGSIILDEPLGATIADDEGGAGLSLDGLVRAVAGLLLPAADAETRAAELVGEAARRVAPRLLSEASLDERIAELRLAYSGQAEPGAAADGGGM